MSGSWVTGHAGHGSAEWWVTWVIKFDPLSALNSLTEKLPEEANRKWPKGARMVTWPMTLRDPNGPIRLVSNISRTLIGSYWGGSEGSKGCQIDRCKCKPHVNTICDRRGAVVYKRHRVGIFCRLSTMHGTVTCIANRNRRNRLSAISRNNSACVTHQLLQLSAVSYLPRVV